MARGMRKSLVGQRFGKLVVKEYKGTDAHRNSLWLCECDCGRTIIEKGSWLTKGLKNSGRVVSCGKCSNKFSLDEKPINEDEEIDKSLIGQKFGKLTIDDIYMKEYKNGRRNLTAKCTCECGNQTEIRMFAVKNGRTLSCGCLQKEKVRKSKFLLTDDFIGKRFGKLTVVDYDDEKRKWKVKCDCGNEIFLTKGNLTVNGWRSCGNCYGRRTKNIRTKKERENGKN